MQSEVGNTHPSVVCRRESSQRKNTCGSVNANCEHRNSQRFVIPVDLSGDLARSASIDTGGRREPS